MIIAYKQTRASFLCIAGTCLLVAGCMIAPKRCGSGDATATIMEDLRSGALHLGSSGVEVFPRGCPQDEHSRTMKDGRVFGVSLYADQKGNILLLYWEQPSDYHRLPALYAACHLADEGHIVDRWFFCDTDRLRESIEQSIAGADFSEEYIRKAAEAFDVKASR